MFTKQHYLQFAAMAYRLRSEGHVEASEIIRVECATIFRADNPRFDEERWFRACTEGMTKARAGTKYRRAS